MHKARRADPLLQMVRAGTFLVWETAERQTDAEMFKLDLGKPNNKTIRQLPHTQHVEKCIRRTTYLPYRMGTNALFASADEPQIKLETP